MPLITSAVFGLIFPEITKGIGSVVGYFQAKAEHERKIELMKLAHNQEIDLKDIEGFNKAQMDLSGGMAYPQGASTWQQWVCLSVNAFIHVVRPTLTVCAVALLFYILCSTAGVKRDELLDEIVFTSVAILRYWFGYREDLRSKGGK